MAVVEYVEIVDFDDEEGCQLRSQLRESKKEECAAVTIDDRSFSGFYRQRRDRCYVDVAIFVGFQYPVALKVLWRVLAVFQQTQLTSRCDKVQDYFA